LTRNAPDDDARGKRRAEHRRVKPIGTVERGGCIAAQRLAPRVACGQKQSSDRTRGVCIRLRDIGEIRQPLSRRPDHEQRGARANPANLRIEALRVGNQLRA
jgi:hypothetical protein